MGEMNMNILYKLTEKDIDRGVDVLARAFGEYSIFGYIMGDKSTPENVKLFTRFMLKHAILYAKAYATSENLEGIILFSDYSRYKFGLVRSIRSGVLPLMQVGNEVGRRFSAFDHATKKIHKRCIKQDHQYVILIGVDPEHQGKGYGTKLMEYVLTLAKEKEMACYLETHGDKNLNFYTKLGFKKVSEDMLVGSDFLQYAMLKE